MPVSVLLSETARAQLAELCSSVRTDQPLVVVTWREPSAELRRSPSGASVLERVSGAGSVQVASGGGKVPAKSIVHIQGIPFLRDVLPKHTPLHIAVSGGVFVVARHGA